MTEIHNFYANLYDKDSGSIPSDEFLKGINSKMLTDEQARKVRYQNNHNWIFWSIEVLWEKQNAW